MKKYFIIFFYIPTFLHTAFDLPPNFYQLAQEEQKEILDARNFALYNKNAGEEFEKIAIEENLNKSSSNCLKKIVNYLCCCTKK